MNGILRLVPGAAILHLSSAGTAAEAPGPIVPDLAPLADGKGAHVSGVN